MKVLSIMTALVLVFASVGSAAWVDPPSWDIIDLDFGTSKDSFLGTGGFVQCDWYGTGVDPLAESLSADYSTLTATGTSKWAGIINTTAVPDSGSYTVDLRVAVPTTVMVGIGVWPTAYSGNNPELRWVAGSGPEGSGPDLRDNVDWDPILSFTVTDQTAWNTYRVVVDTSSGTGVAATVSLYLDGNMTPVVSGTGFDHVNSYQRIQLWGDSGSSHDYDYLRIAFGAWGPPLIAGDTNNDGKVDHTDATTILGNWGTGTTLSEGDVDGDNDVDNDDLLMVIGNWGSGFPPPEAPSSGVPEPSALLILAGGLLAALFRRR